MSGVGYVQGYREHVRGEGDVSRGPCTVRSKLNKFKHDQGGRSLSSEVPEW